MEKKILKTLFEILAIDAPSGHEGELADLLVNKLVGLGFNTKKDKKGNVIGFLKGRGEPLLLTAHMDRVPPGKGHKPVRDGDIIKSDGSTNLGTDDAAGISIILEAVKSIIQENINHTSLVVLFTVEEEIGLAGARAADLSEFKVKRGIGYDNAFDAGVVVGSGSTYEGFDVEIIGKSMHPAKNLSKAINAIKIFQEIDWGIGESDSGKTRINVGVVNGGTARNVIPGSVKVLGEMRTILGDDDVRERLKKLEENVKTVCDKYSAKYTFSIHRHSSSYKVNENEPLLQVYKRVLEIRVAKLIMNPTFVGSDANVFRAEQEMDVFTISTGVVGEHTVDEYIKISDLVQLTEDLVS